MLTPPAAAIDPTLRSTARGPLPGYLLLLGAPALYALARGHRDLTMATTFLAIAGPPVVALAFDDPVEATLNACPTTRNTRRRARAALIVAALATVAAVVAIAIAATGADTGPIRDRMPESAAAAAVSLAAAACAARAGISSPGVAAALATPLTMATTTGLSIGLKSFDFLPQIGNPYHANRWWIIAATAATVTWWWSRDPASRGPTRFRRRAVHDARQRGGRSRPSVVV